MPSSNRLKLLIVAILIAVAKEVAAHNGIEIPMETFLTVEGLILGLMGLDTARPLGRGYPPESEAATEVVESASAESEASE